MAISRSFLWQLKCGDDPFAIPVPFDPKAVFGRMNAPVIVAIGGHSYRSTITNMGGSPWIPLRKSNRDAAALPATGPIAIVLTLDEAERTVAVPQDLAAVLAGIAGAPEAWSALSVTARREHAEAIEGAKKPETRARRIAAAVQAVQARLAR